MTDRPITFSAPMVRALLDGRKTQTRRLLKPLGDNTHLQCTGRGDWFWWTPDVNRAHVLQRIPYAPGDRFYVREAWRTEARFDDRKPLTVPPGEWIWFEAQDDVPFEPSDAGRLRPGRFMPRWASRITLTVTEVRVQRLQEISAGDSIAEGVECDTCTAMGQSACHGRGCFASIDAYRHLWNSLHGPDAWDANPWVVAISFTVEKKNIDTP